MIISFLFQRVGRAGGVFFFFLAHSLWQFVLEGRYLFLMRYLPGLFNIFGGKNKNKNMGRAVFQGRARMITNYFLYMA